MLNAEYFKRIDALNYTMLHDDGQHADDLEEADVVLVGVSRTSKTPTSIYLANRGVKTANVPLVPGMPVPPQLEALAQPLVVGPDREPGAHRADPPEPAARPAAPQHDDDQYVDRQAVAEEIAFSRKLCGKHNWPIIDVTRRSIEETAAAVMALLAERRRQPVGVSDAAVARRATAGARLAERGAPGAAGGGRHSDRDRAGRYRRARDRARAGAGDAGDGGGAAGAREGAVRWRQACRAGWCSAPTRRWRSATRRFSKPRRPRRRRASSSRRCAARPMRCIRRSRWCATARCCSSMSTPRS